MQLNRVPRRKKKGPRIAASLFAATCTLLGSPSGPSIASDAKPPDDKRWSFDTSLSTYTESDRVSDYSAGLLAKGRFRRGMLRLRLAVDTLTGASASGAVPSTGVQTFTSPSGEASYTTPAGETPLDPTFLDTRVAVSANWERPLGERGIGAIDFGVSLSREYDYLHTGVNARWSREFNSRNTRFSAGLAFASDTIDPVGGAPVPLAAMLPEEDTSNKLGDDSKTVADLLVGVTQVLGKRTIGQFNYGFTRSSGYLTDPYKLLSVIDPVTGDPVAGPGGLFLYRFEKRPDQRTKHSLFGQIKHRLKRDVIDGSYRFMTDDWGVGSHTIDLRWRHPLSNGWYIQPHLRYYTQSAADFYAPFLLDGDPLPEDATADYRLGDLDDITAGLKLGAPLANGEIWFRLEYYQQSGRSPPGVAIGSLAGLDLAPTVDAIIAQVGYRF